jgi:Tn3 transposase DDE domain
VLDGILDNETELPIAEHTSDTAGYTDLVFSSALPVRRAASAAHRRTDQQGRGLARATRIPLCGKRSVPISRWQKQQEAGFG